VVFWYEKIHARWGYQWVHPVHEVLKWVGEGSPGPMVTAEGVQLDHHPDPEKSRSQYLPLLELSVREAPEDDRNVHYLGREYMYRGRWDDCIRTLKGHLAMPTALWRDERAASMRYIAKAYWEKGEPAAARDWYLRAITEAPHLREPYMDLALMLYLQGEWEGVLYFTACALAITVRPRSYICEAAAWGSLPHDLRAMAFYHTGAYLEAVAEAGKALELEPENPRLKENLEILKELAEG
jgi:tetratricopeptide (TPR) repeat protein